MNLLNYTTTAFHSFQSVFMVGGMRFLGSIFLSQFSSKRSTRKTAIGRWSRFLTMGLLKTSESEMVMCFIALNVYGISGRTFKIKAIN